MTEEQLRELRDLISGLKMEYYDLLHEFGYADFKLKEEPIVGYEAKELWLSGVYEKAFMDWHTHQLELAKIDAKIEELNKVIGGYSWIDLHNLEKLKLNDGTKFPITYIKNRLSELTKQKDLLTNESK